MKVYLVTYSDLGGLVIKSVWTTREAAEREAAGLCAEDRVRDYEVEEWDVRE